MVKIGNCCFSEKGITLSIHDTKVNIEGSIKFQQLSPIHYDIMGPFKYIPFMQCRHSVFSMKHSIEGQIALNGNNINFLNGIGYIEGDCGTSFPDRYIWTQCCFEEGSLMLSVADIPFCGLHFTGIIGVIHINGKEYRIATYLGACAKHIGENTVTVKQGNYQFTAKLLEKKAYPLYAPISGMMSRTIRESAACKAYYCFSYKGKLICEFTSDRASFEFEYI